jgi:hypothetical protein
MILRYAVLWLGLPVIGILNGAIREIAYKDALGELSAHQLSSFIIVLLISVYVWVLGGRWKLSSSLEALAIGLIWLAQTIMFEFLFGHYVMGRPWDLLFADYNVFEGRFWSIVVFWVAVAPLIVYRVQHGTVQDNP